MGSEIKVVFTVTVGLVVGLLLGLAGMLVLNFMHTPIDDSIKQIVSAMLGSVGTLLAKTWVDAKVEAAKNGPAGTTTVTVPDSTTVTVEPIEPEKEK